MPMLVSDHLLALLQRWNVRRLFGYPGDGVNGVMGALGRLGAAPPDSSGRRTADGGAPGENGAGATAPRLEFIQAAHEELAALMATAHAKFTAAAGSPEPGVVVVTSGPGATHALTGLYDAKLDHQPVVAIVGQQGVTGLGGSEQQEIDLKLVLQDVASAYCEMVVHPEQLRHVVDRAFRIALAQRTVTAIILPNDVQRLPAAEHPPQEHGRQHASAGYTAPRLVPHDAELRAAADVLAAGKKIALLIGAGALHAGDEVLAVAEVLGAGVAKALLGKAATPDDHPLVTGSVGWLGTPASNRMLKACDTLFMIGTSFPYSEFLPKEGQARCVQIDSSAANLGLRYPAEVALQGDSAETLRALLPLLTPSAERDAWRAEVTGWIRESHEAAERHANAPANPINPQQVVWEMNRQLPDRVVLTGDSGSSALLIARDVQIRRGMLFSVSGGLATMGSAMPYAVAAKFAQPDRVVVAIVGDGAMQMSGINSLIDVAKHWKRWADPRLVVLALNNRDLNYVTWEQRVMEGDPRNAVTQSLPDLPYADLGRLLGFDGVRVERPEDVADAWRRAFAADRPFVIDALVDPDVPTLPPELKPAQEDKLTQALSSGDDRADGVLDQLQRQDVRQGAG
ncbi:MAG TPA: thiamine pyrophosphate-requiring protein [Gemmatirosa sp.]